MNNRFLTFVATLFLGRGAGVQGRRTEEQMVILRDACFHDKLSTEATEVITFCMSEPTSRAHADAAIHLGLITIANTQGTL